METGRDGDGERTEGMENKNNDEKGADKEWGVLRLIGEREDADATPLAPYRALVLSRSLACGDG